MNKKNLLSTPIVVRSFNVEKDPFRSCENDEEVYGPEIPYLSIIEALIYIANCNRPDIVFVINVLVGFNSYPTTGTME